MKANRLVVAIAALMTPWLAAAHTTTRFTVPGNGAKLKTPPAQILLAFKEAARITSLTLQKKGETAEQKLGPLSGETAERFTMAAPKLLPGEYTLRYRILCLDKHIESGTVKFLVSAPAP